jgi:CRISPR-associated protein Cmr2
MSDPFVNYISECLAAKSQASLNKIKLLVQEVFESEDTPDYTKLQDLQTRITELLPDGADRIDLVYGGVTKVKGYVFEASKLPEIRGASAILDWINEVELPRLWDAKDPEEWEEKGIIYSSGGNILAFAPAGEGQQRANQIEQCYMEHTLTANSAAVAATFSLLELRYGRLRKKADGGFYWIDDFLADWQNEQKREMLKHYYYLPEGVVPTDEHEEAARQRFYNRKTFGELVTVLATMFNRRRDERSEHGETRFLPTYPMLPWAEKCDSSDMRPAVYAGRVAEEERLISEASARKRYIGQMVKGKSEGATKWFTRNFDWQPTDIQERSWEQEWRKFLESEEGRNTPYARAYQQIPQADKKVEPASDLHEIGASSKRYIGMIYADGNNIGRLIATLKTPGEYKKTSDILRNAARDAVFTALAYHLEPVQVAADKEREQDEQPAKEGTDKTETRKWIHPFEILTIGGDDLSLIVPANRAFEIALTIAYAFESDLMQKLKDGKPSNPLQDRYRGKDKSDNPDTAINGFAELKPKVGLSAGVVIAQENAPVFFLQDLVEGELLKSGKKLARRQAKYLSYYGGAIDFMVMKSITMVTDKIKTFRKEALGQGKRHQLTARPYTWHEFAGLLATLRALKQAGVPRSQLYRLREVLQTAIGAGITRSILEYLHTRVRLRSAESQTALLEHIERNWRSAAEAINGRSEVVLPPWLRQSKPAKDEQQGKGLIIDDGCWETIWADLVEMYDMVDEEYDDHYNYSSVCTD